MRRPIFDGLFGGNGARKLRDAPHLREARCWTPKRNARSGIQHNDHAGLEGIQCKQPKFCFRRTNRHDRPHAVHEARLWLQKGHRRVFFIHQLLSGGHEASVPRTSRLLSQSVARSLPLHRRCYIFEEPRRLQHVLQSARILIQALNSGDIINNI